MEVTLTYIKDTKRTSAKNNREYTSRSIKTQEHGDQWLSGFAGKENAGWKVGDKVEIEVKEVKKDDKTYLNFETPKKDDYAKMAYDNTELILNRLVGIGLAITALEKRPTAPKTEPTEDEMADEYFEEPTF